MSLLHAAFLCNLPLRLRRSRKTLISAANSRQSPAISTRSHLRSDLTGVAMSPPEEEGNSTSPPNLVAGGRWDLPAARSISTVSKTLLQFLLYSQVNMTEKLSKAEKKVKYDKKMCSTLDEYTKVPIVFAVNFGSNQLQSI